MPDVVVVGAGPVGTFVAAELSRHGADVVLLEQRAVAGFGSRAIGLHAPALDALEAGGATERILSEAVRVGEGHCRADRPDGTTSLVGTVRFDRLRTRFPFVATLPQSATEAALGRGAPPAVRGTRVTSLHHDQHRVRVRAVGPHGEHEWDAGAVVVAGGGGGRDLVYRAAGIRVRHYLDRYLMADADVAPRHDAATAVVTLAAGGVLESFPLPAVAGGRRRFVAWDGFGPEPPTTSDARDERLRAALRERGEADAADSVSGATTFRVRRAVAPSLRRGRVVVIGDAAHEVSPIGGQGMNLGLLDAAGLAPLLASWMRTGVAPDAALERWERRRVQSARIAATIATANTMLGRPRGAVGHAARTAALRTLLAPGPGALFARAYSMGFDRGV